MHSSSSFVRKRRSRFIDPDRFMINKRTQQCDDLLDLRVVLSSSLAEPAGDAGDEIGGFGLR